MAVIETYRPGSEGQDTYVMSTLSAVNNGSEEYMEVGRLGSDEARAFMKFDVPLRPGWDVLNAILRINVDDFESPADPAIVAVQAHRVGSGWDENTATWNNQPGVSGAALASVTVAGTGTYTFGIAQAIEAWQAGQNNNGIRLAYAAGGDANWLIFNSSDHPNANTRPYIEVTWTAKAPNAPVVQIDGFPANESAVLSWRFSHDDPNAQQTAYQVEILKASDGTPMLTQSKTASSSQQIPVPAGTLENGVEYQIRVKTWGPEDVEGPWSAFDLFTTAERPAATITAPAAAEVVTTSAYTVTWDYTGVVVQAQYRLRLYEQPSNVLAFDSGVVNSSSTSQPVTGLKDATTYRIELEVWNQAGIENAVSATLNFQVDTVPPATPTVQVDAAIELGVVALTITNPPPAAGQVATDHNEVWRRVPGASWTRLAASVPPNATFQDASAGGGVPYDYRVVAVSVVDTAAEVVASVTLTLFGVWLHEPHDPIGTLVHLYFDGLARDEQWAPELELLRFAGRKGAVADFGPQDAVDMIQASVQLASGTDDRKILRELARKRVVVCYRDGQNRKTYGVISNLTITDEKYGGSAQFRVEVVDHIETGV